LFKVFTSPLPASPSITRIKQRRKHESPIKDTIFPKARRTQSSSSSKIADAAEPPPPAQFQKPRPKIHVERKEKKVVRGKEERKRLHGHDCECCSGYYEATKDIPGLIVKYNVKVLIEIMEELGKIGNRPRVDIEGIRDQSVHQVLSIERYFNALGFWDTHFPDTQEVRKLKDDYFNKY
jgi:hypothetical protein